MPLPSSQCALTQWTGTSGLQRRWKSDGAEDGKNKTAPFYHQMWRSMGERIEREKLEQEEAFRYAQRTERWDPLKTMIGMPRSPLQRWPGC